jgi:hypothetical protein
MLSKVTDQSIESHNQRRSRQVTKKDQIISFFLAGITNIQEIATIVGSRPSYVAAVLQNARLLSGYFDLYTTSTQPMNVYSGFFAGKLGYKDAQAAHQSVELLNQFYEQFESEEDRAGQHHALVMALTMFNRARWIGKTQEAEIFRRWLLSKLSEATVHPNLD